MGAKTTRPNQEPRVVLDIEAGTITARDIKAAREIAADTMTDRAFQRLRNRIADEARDENPVLTRATRDRDRSTPRDVSHVESERLRGDLPEPESFRSALSAQQRKIRSALKNRVLSAAPASQLDAVRTVLTDEDSASWRQINRRLHRAAGDVHQLDEAERKTVQRLDRAIQSYERLNDRSHTVYVSVELPSNHRDVRSDRDLPASLFPGGRVSFDQFTVARHSLRETPGHDSRRHVMFEISTSRGMYFGRSDSIEDTTHLLPRGMNFQVVAVDSAPYESGPHSFSEHPVVVQLREI
ncbi:hypothetical protein CFA71_24350 [Mycobacteroides abscessus subsp. bolletii]|nr:hypothetical protein CFA71_24350 [Mycobacteroides abscessus subsp. bolletii]